MVPSQSGYTALIWASLNGHLEVVKALVAAKADVNAKNNVGQGGHCVWQREVLIAHHL